MSTNKTSTVLNKSVNALCQHCLALPSQRTYSHTSCLSFRLIPFALLLLLLFPHLLFPSHLPPSFVTYVSLALVSAPV